MLDPLILRNDIEKAAADLQVRGYALDTGAYRTLEAKRKALQLETEALQSKRNSSAKAIGQAKARGEDIQPLLDAVAQLGAELDTVETQFKGIREQQTAWLLDMPNLAAGDVPVGADQSDNLEVRKWGAIPTFDYEPRDHVELGELHQYRSRPLRLQGAGQK